MAKLGAAPLLERGWRLQHGRNVVARPASVYGDLDGGTTPFNLRSGAQIILQRAQMSE